MLYCRNNLRRVQRFTRALDPHNSRRSVSQSKAQRARAQRLKAYQTVPERLFQEGLCPRCQRKLKSQRYTNYWKFRCPKGHWERITPHWAFRKL